MIREVTSPNYRKDRLEVTLKLDIYCQFFILSSGIFSWTVSWHFCPIWMQIVAMRHLYSNVQKCHCGRVWKAKYRYCRGKNKNVYLFFEPWCTSVVALGWVSGSSSVNLFVYPWEYLRSSIIDFSDEKLLWFNILTSTEFTLDSK